MAKKEFGADLETPQCHRGRHLQDQLYRTVGRAVYFVVTFITPHAESRDISATKVGGKTSVIVIAFRAS